MIDKEKNMKRDKMRDERFQNDLYFDFCRTKFFVGGEFFAF